MSPQGSVARYGRVWGMIALMAAGAFAQKAYALYGLENKSTDQLLDSLAWMTDVETQEEIVKRADSDMDLICGALLEADPRKVNMVLAVLKRITPPRTGALPCLRKALDISLSGDALSNPTEDFHSEVLRLLAEGGEEGRSMLRSVIKTASRKELRWDAADALLRADPKADDAIPVLIEAARGGTERSPLLATTGRPDGLQILLGLLIDDSREVRFQAATSLPWSQKSVSPETRLALTALLDSSDDYVQANVARFFGLIDGSLDADVEKKLAAMISKGGFRARCAAETLNAKGSRRAVRKAEFYFLFVRVRQVAFFLAPYILLFAGLAFISGALREWGALYFMEYLIIFATGFAIYPGLRAFGDGAVRWGLLVPQMVGYIFLAHFFHRRSEAQGYRFLLGAGAWAISLVVGGGVFFMLLLTGMH